MGDEQPDIDAIAEQPEAMYALLVQLKELVISLQQTIEELRAENVELKRMLFGKKSEKKIPPIGYEVRAHQHRSGKQDPEKRRQATQAKRKRRREAKQTLPTQRVEHVTIRDYLSCPHCGGQDFRPLGKGEVSYEFEYVPAQLIRRKHVREKLACSCGRYVVTAPGPARVSEGVQYGPGFHAHVAVSKCADAIPLHRLAKQFRRAGVPLGKSTLCDIFHRSAELLAPLRARMLELVKQSPLVNADETPLPILAEGKTHRGYMWDFITNELVVYVATPSRSGETPRRILQQSAGTLQVDGYTGYNAVTVPNGRTRAGCWAHCRRYFWKALETAPADARWYLDRIRDLYAVEYHAAEREILGTAEHLALRQECSAVVMDEMALWLEQERPSHPPKSPLGKAFTYLHNNLESLGVFLKDAAVALDNNISERLLRIVALGRKNFLFVGNEEAGDRLAILQSLVSSCELNGVNPQAYLSDVLIRIQTHPASAIDELLPHRWKPINSS